MTTLLRVQAEKSVSVAIEVSGREAGSAFIQASDNTQREFLRGMLSAVEAVNRARLPQEQFWWEVQCTAIVSLNGAGDGAALNDREKRQIVRVLQSLIDALDATPEPADLERNDPES